MKKLFFVFLILFLFSNCKTKKSIPSGKDVCNKDSIENLNDWTIVHNNVINRDTLRYKHDTSVFLIKQYAHEQRLLSTLYFFKNKKQGVFLTYGLDGAVLMRQTFDDGIANGMLYAYDHKHVLKKIFEKQDSIIYIVNYDHEGNILDSVHR